MVSSVSQDVADWLLAAAKTTPPKGFRTARSMAEAEFWLTEPGTMWIPGERFGGDEGTWVLYHPMMDEMVKREAEHKKTGTTDAREASIE